MDKEIKRPRKDRRELLKLNGKFDELVGKCVYELAVNGETDEVFDLIDRCDKSWKRFVNNHNKNHKNVLRAEPGSLMKEVNRYIAESAITARKIKEEEERARYDRWIAKVTMRYPRLMWKWSIIAKFNRNYVRKKYEEFQGKSPRGTWL